MYSAVICAAGAGSRMGMPKALCHFHDQTFLQNILYTLNAAGVRHAVIVVGAQAERIIDVHQSTLNALKDSMSCDFVVSNNWACEYMLETLARGIAHVSKNSGVIHWPVDCVDVHTDDVRALLLSNASLKTLAWAGIPGHPMAMDADAVLHFRKNNETYQSLRDFVDEIGVAQIEAQYDSLQNCNTPERLHQYLLKHP